MQNDATGRKALLSRIRSGAIGVEEAVRLLSTPEARTPVGEAPRPEAAEAAEAAEERTGRLADWLCGIVAAEARVPADTIDPDEPLDRYGFDSVMALNVVRAIEAHVGTVSATLLFEHQTVSALADHLALEHAEAVGRLLSATVGPTPAASARAHAAPVNAAPVNAAPTAAPAAPRDGDTRVAVVGISGRFPQAENLDAFWENLVAGRDCVTEVPESRWDHRRHFDPRPGVPGKSYTKWGGFLDGIDEFDAEFFRISPREAERMDPQERLVLQEVWHAFEDGGLTRARLAGEAVGVYIGVMYSQYQLLQAEEAVRGNPLYLGSSYASIANRVSHFFDLRGPSLAVDTMCSSSLTAIHLACEALARGDVSAAVAGGVNLTLHPAKHIDLSQGRYAAGDGRCRSFGEGGDGYVPGEGVGAVVLKRLDDALADGDRVHAVIRGSATAHGGKTNGYTVPNPNEQARLIAEVCRRAGIAPRDIGFVEAHGTGTSLGDPIEVTALARALGPRPEGQPPTAIGSVKSSIGHLEGAAGIAGLAKVVLQLRHRRLVPSLHADPPNPHIDFEAAGLRLQRTAEDWPARTDQAGAPLPRLAGISSFGAGGANAHLIVEEPPPPRPVPSPAVASPRLVLLSAPTEEGLRAQAGALADYAGRHHATAPDEGAAWLAGAAYTLREGREAFEHRLALVVPGVPDLVERLRDFAEHRARDGARDGVLLGTADGVRGKPRRGADPEPATEDDLEGAARRWVRGETVDWSRLDTPAPPRVGLPGYPFRPERHWPQLSHGAAGVGLPVADPAIRHPLLDRNVSVFGRQRFVTAFSLAAPLVRDHLVAGRALLPGAAVVEMVLAAAAESGFDGAPTLADLVWDAPVEVPLDGTHHVEVTLVPRGADPAVADFTVSGAGEDGGAVHVRGRVLRGSARAAEPAADDGLGLLDVTAIAAACTTRIDGESCYRRFDEQGLRYGPVLRVLESVRSGAGEALGRIQLDASGRPRAPETGYRLHPALLDGAFQTLVAFDDPASPGPARVPFAVERVLTGPGPLPDACWVHARPRPGALDEQGRPQVFDLTLADDGGRVVARVEGLVVRPVRGVRSAVVALRPVWQPAARPAAAERAPRTVLVFDRDDAWGLADALAAEAAPATRIVRVLPGERFRRMGEDRFEIVPGDGEHHERLLAELAGPTAASTAETTVARAPFDAVVHAWAGGPSAADAAVTAHDLETGFHALLGLTAALARRAPGAPVRLVCLTPAEAPAFGAVGGFCRAVAAEHPSYAFTTLTLPAPGGTAARRGQADARLVAAELAAAVAGGEEVRYDGEGNRQARRLVETEGAAAGAARPEPQGARLRTGGVYLVTGALGGLGRQLALHLARRWQARLVLSGRSPRDGDTDHFLRELEEHGARACYVAADCATEDGARTLVDEARARFGGLDGVLHLAGVLRDGLVARKTRNHAEAVVRPKVWGAHHLDLATRRDPLDFFALFSSASGVTGVAGQSDYAFANAFLDGFAEWREGRRHDGDRSGATVSIAWPLWEAGGMDVDEKAKRWIEENLGWVPLPVETGMRVFESVLGGAHARSAVFHGRRATILRTLLPVDDDQAAGRPGVDTEPEPQQAPEPEGPPAGADASAAERKLLDRLTRLVAEELRMPPARVEPRTPFERYGLESVMVMNVTRELEEVFGELPKTLFFEHRCLADLCRYLVESHPRAVAEHFGQPAARPVAEPVAEPAASPAPVVAEATAVARPSATGVESSAVRDEPIAIVGVSGRYPMADTLEEFWQNLKDGRDCVTEVPRSRWDHARYFAPDTDGAGTTYAKWGGFLRDVDRFDPLFFNIAPREARLMDPQERIFLQAAWHALEDAGHARSAPGGRRTGVYVGVMYAQYQLYGAAPAAQSQGFVPGSLSASVANRVSYVLGLNGPSVALDTMCSSSLTALHLACAGIRLGDCDEALVGGVNAILHPNRYLQLSQAKFASTDGRCRSFGEGGDGYVPGEGVGALLLKPLSRAEADGDHVYAVIRGTAVNHGGRSNGFTVPTPTAQGDVIGEALRRAGVDPAEIGYVEAHGTGTALGDPIEIAGLNRAFAALGKARQTSCPIGSVKSNIGHLESAAGVAAITKVLLQFRHRALVPSLHAERLNPHIAFDGGPFEVQRSYAPWQPRRADGRDLPLLAAVSSFGAGGSNAHAILEEYVPRAAERSGGTESGRGTELVVLSARTETQLRGLAGSLADAVLPGSGPTASPAGILMAEADLRTAVSDILGVPADFVDLDEDLESLGFDPVTLAELAEHLRAVHGEAAAAAAAPSGQRSLRELAEALAESSAPATGAGDRDPDRLRDIAFTLGAGREPQSERLALVVADIRELATTLREFADGHEPSTAYRGRADGHSGLLDDLLDGQEGAAFLAAVRRSGDLTRLARLWTAGLDAAGEPQTRGEARRVPLPGYPFARDRYWVPELPESPEPTAPSAPPASPETVEAAVAGREEPPVAEASPPRPAETPAAPVVPPAPPSPAPAASAGPDLATVTEVVVTAMAAVLEVPAEEFQPDVPHSDFGVDSVLAVEIVERINKELGTDLRPTDFFNYPTLRRLAEHVAEMTGADASGRSDGGGAPEGTPEPAAPAVASPAPTPPVPTAPAAVSTAPAPTAPAVPDLRAASAPVAVGPDDIAVIGMSGRFADAADLDELWANLAAGRDSVREIPRSRWDAEVHWDPDPRVAGKTYSKWGSVLEGIDRFDPDFFGISPREARLMDPQQRLFQMEAWRAIEDAGYSDRSLDGVECPVFVGTSMGDYHHLLREHGVPVEGYTFMGTHPAVLSSRLSYHLNLKGASLAVDTSCSSSLMAVHLACEALREGRGELALAGGVAALATPELHILASKAGMLSPRGRCRPFDDGADGFVPGEGVGVVLLKRLDHALRDGDHIHGVIAGTGANQDGRTSGITAPSAPAQSGLLRSVYERFGIDPGRIGYVECHGTGTRLGDPIEVEALTDTFRAFTERRGYCAVGSIKSNLGHTLTASGVAGLFKVLLSLKHRRLAPTVHFRTPNQHIPFDESPFYVSSELAEWPTEDGAARLAAVSSFGFSGTNVHAVVREAPAGLPRPAEEPGRPRLCPVSAKSRQALDERLTELSAWLRRHGAEHEWRDIAYTLGVGRSHFPVRAAFVARGAEELRERIEAWRRSADPETAVRASAHAGELERLATAFVHGESVDWEAVNGGDHGRRIPLPTYPFAQESCWVPSAQPPARSSAPGTVAPVAGEEEILAYPLRPEQPLVRDHVVDGKPLLPAAGHLSLVHRAALALLGDVPVTVRRAVWLRPFFVTDALTAEVCVRAAAGGGYSFEVRGPDGTGAVQTFSRGELSAGAGADDRTDLDDVRARCTGGMPVADHYARFDRMGVRYGPHFRTVVGIRSGAGEGLVALAREDGGTELPAGVMDGAVQAVAAIQPEGTEQRPLVPFSMAAVRLLRPVPAESWAHVRQTRAQECDVTVLDGDGRPCVVVEGLSYRELKEPVPLRVLEPVWQPRERGGEPATGAVGSVWVVTPPHDHGLAARLAALHRDADVRIVRLDPEDGGAWTTATATVTGGLPDPERVYFLGGLPVSDALGASGASNASDTPGTSRSAADLERALESGVRSLIRLVKGLLPRNSGDRPLDLIAVTGDGHALTGAERPEPAAAALFGLCRSLAKEYPGWRVGCVDVATRELTGPGADAVARSVAADRGHPDGDETVLRDSVRWKRVLRVTDPAPPRTAPFRTGGTYLILGGAGGIGAVTALHLARRAGANVALLGRRAATPGVEEHLRAIEAAGGRALYVRADATDAASLASAVAEVRRRFGPIHGAFHSALVLADSRVADLEEPALDAVLAPKVRGSVLLVEALRAEPLDFLVLYSSAQSFSGNAGQSNYAAASTFQDALGAGLAAEGRPVHVLNWGYWGEVGVVAKASYRRRMAAMGVHSITPEEGMRALETVLAGGLSQAMPIKAEQRLLDRLGVLTDAHGPDSAVCPEPGTAGAAADGPRLRRAHDALDALGAKMVLRALQELGAFRKPGDRLPASGVATALGVVPQYRQLADALADILVGSGYVECSGRDLCAKDRVTEAEGCDLSAEARQLAAHHPEVAAHVELLEACVQAYPRLLTGKVDPTEVLFPDSSMRRVENVYRGDPLATGANETAAGEVAEAARRRGPGGRPLRVLEVGAGTGGTTRSVLPALTPYADRVEYVYTDVSSSFLRHGRREFAAQYPFVTFKRLDVEQPPGAQGFEEGGFDVVVAANVLHATQDLGRTLAHVRRLLADDGRLVLCETTAFSAFTTLTFGLLPGWWRFEDGVRRIPASPLADTETWQELLKENGFDRTVVLEAVPGAPRGLGLHVLVADVRGPEIPAQRTDRTAGQEPDPGRSSLEDVQRRLAEYIARTLGRDEADLDPERPFTEYGVDSIILVELVSTLNTELGIELGTTALFDHPTLTALARFVHADHAPAASAARAADDTALPGPHPSGPVGGPDEEDMLRRLAAGDLTLEEAYMELGGPA
ncbi:SDR family NAD(P)-dependent oxidoreductase [Streptomyces sp. JJ38]|uniref:SDR family NAD(P)-dependent oxidoreductase n=1 Tax=Streptomyces sp. JJ38 TaxID=2738128 RepID=UPI001C59B8CE|nr:SDR family NAD(P)-dependent oxidoreductase [Streptomyces sp. JJ38]MBW1597681.1 SDR family NAD(P)-dependent oxidoreductase [Streptomyces sp. JJ38]